MEENTNNLELDPSVISQRNKKINNETALNEYGVELFEKRTENTDYNLLKEELFLNDEVLLSYNTQNLFKEQVDYSPRETQGNIFHIISYILMGMVAIEVLYITYKIIKRRRNKKTVKNVI